MGIPVTMAIRAHDRPRRRRSPTHVQSILARRCSLAAANASAVRVCRSGCTRRLYSIPSLTRSRQRDGCAARHLAMSCTLTTALRRQDTSGLALRPCARRPLFGFAKTPVAAAKPGTKPENATPMRGCSDTSSLYRHGDAPVLHSPSSDLEGKQENAKARGIWGRAFQRRPILGCRCRLVADRPTWPQPARKGGLRELPGLHSLARPVGSQGPIKANLWV